VIDPTPAAAAELDRMRAGLDRVTAERDRARAELDALMATRLMRAARLPRAAYARLRTGP